MLEGEFIGMGRLREPADLPDELKRRSLNFRVGGGRLEIEKWSDVSAHTYNDGALATMSSNVQWSAPQLRIES